MAKWPYGKKPTKTQSSIDAIIERMAQADLERFAEMRGMSVDEMIEEERLKIERRDAEDELDRQKELGDVPPPSTIYYAVQSQTGFVKTKRPDRKREYGYYYANPTGAGVEEEGSKKGAESHVSTRVHAFQWIPTTADTGDILVAFARPSNAQTHTLYVYPNHNESSWSTFAFSSDSLGKAVNGLGAGRPYVDSDRKRYEAVHLESDTDKEGNRIPWDYWIFNAIADFTEVRPNNEGLGSGATDVV
jgi:hypothetical protein